MAERVLEIDGISKEYRLGMIGGGTLHGDLTSWFARVRGKEDPNVKIGKEHLSRNERFWALKDVSFNVDRGDAVALLGRNGAGKSTMLKLISRITAPTEGEIRIRGRVASLLEIGTGFHPELSGRDNIYLNGTMMNIPRKEIDRMVPEIVEFADIGEFLRQPVKSYSSGMFARLAFSVAVSVRPEILIVDEALSVGDVFFQTKCYKKFDEFQKSGMTILFVSHDLSAISRYCSRAVLLNQGVMEGEGEPKAMVDLYKKILSGRRKGLEKPESSLPRKAAGEAGFWQDAMECNPDTLEYGDHSADIIDFGLFDAGGRLTNTIVKGEPCTIRMKVLFNRDIREPIFAFSIKNRMGIELTGTNTMIENCETGLCREGETVTVSFTQPVMLQGAEYLLSLGCTGYGSSELQVYHRLYDVCTFPVTAGKNTVGYFDMGSEVKLEKEGPGEQGGLDG